MKIFGIIAVIFAVVVAVASDKAAEKSPASAAVLEISSVPNKLTCNQENCKLHLKY
ncbi:hypothetical protein Ocin01_19952, partial [Orchesella cincta]